MKLKLNKDGSAVVRNGAPVYVLDNGTEREIDGAAAMKLAIGKHFEASPVMTKLNIPHGMAAAFFGDAFQMQGDRLVAVDKHGIQLHSSTTGAPASFDEAFDQLVASYPSKAKILREGGASGGGAPAGQQRAGNAQPAPAGTINRAQFEALGPRERMHHIQGGGKVAD